MAVPPPRPILLFDGDCGFCRRWVSRWREATGGHVGWIPFQDPRVGEQFPELTPERCARAVQFIAADGEVSEGAAAVFEALAFRPHGHLARAAFRRVPGLAAMSERVYRWVANRRRLFSRVNERPR